jgi:RNA polymerase sigma-70 factor (ECF subfamily)
MTPTANTHPHNAAFDCAALTDGRLVATARTAAARAFGAVQSLCDRKSSSAGVSDETLVTRIAAGDRSAMKVLFTRHQQRVYRFVLRMVANSATAEDIVSEVFFELWRQAASFEGRAQLSTWLLAIARNKSLSAMRHRIDQPLDDALQVADSASTAEETFDVGQRRAVLRQCLAQLSAAHREVVDLVYYHEKSIDEVSVITGVPAATVKTRMFYARKRLAELMKTAGIETVLV